MKKLLLILSAIALILLIVPVSPPATAEITATNRDPHSHYEGGITVCYNTMTHKCGERQPPPR
ncbi:MAG: hypothetical protein QNK37_10845 [Acidobacteriota bacterium]|nr:hypothetical protein [Acidobacteriota bacterium]